MLEAVLQQQQQYYLSVRLLHEGPRTSSGRERGGGFISLSFRLNLTSGLSVIVGIRLRVSNAVIANLRTPHRNRYTPKTGYHNTLSSAFYSRTLKNNILLAYDDRARGPCSNLGQNQVLFPHFHIN